MHSHQSPSSITPTVRRTAADRSALLSRWPAWAGVAAAVWSLLYGLLGLYWTLGGAGFPFGVMNDPHAERVSILERAQPDTAAPVIAALGFGSAVLALMMARTRVGASPSRAVIGLGWTLAATLSIVIPDHRLLMAVARTPIVLIGLPFGWPDEVSFFGPGMYAWPVLNQLLILLGGMLWAATTVAYQRRGRDACTACGRTDAITGWTTPQSAARWGRWAVAIAVLIPLLYAVSRWAWALGIPLGVTDAFLRDEAQDAPDIWLAGALLASVAAGGACLTLGLVQRWGEVYPRWIPVLGGRAVRPALAIVPAALVAVLVLNAGVYAIRAQVLGYYPEDSGLGEANWGTTAPGLLWPLWGAALGAAVLAYYLRRRGPCASCGRGSETQPRHVLGRELPQHGRPQHEPSRSGRAHLWRRTAATAVITAVIALIAAVSPSTPASAAASDRLIVGTGQFTLDDAYVTGHTIRFAVRAATAANGTTHGVLRYWHRLPDGEALAFGRAEVTCLQVSGSTALFTAIVIQEQVAGTASGADLPLGPHAFYIKVIDGGRGPDQIAFFQAIDPPPPVPLDRSCIDGEERFPGEVKRYEIERGGYLIRG